MDCNRCNTNYNRGNYNMRNTMYNDRRSGMQGHMHSNMKNCSMDDKCDMHRHSIDDKCDMHKHTMEDKCGMPLETNCKKMLEHVDHMGPGMGYVPWQEWTEIYEMEKGFERGTIFCQLDKPYIGRCMK